MMMAVLRISMAGQYGVLPFMVLTRRDVNIMAGKYYFGIIIECSDCLEADCAAVVLVEKIWSDQKYQFIHEGLSTIGLYDQEIEKHDQATINYENHGHGCSRFTTYLYLCDIFVP